MSKENKNNNQGGEANKPNTNKPTAKISKDKALGMVAVSPRDAYAMKMIYKKNTDELTVSEWVDKFTADGFNVKNSEELKKI